MEASYSLNNKVCRVCLEEGIFTSIFSAEFAVTPFVMLQSLDLKIYESVDDPRMPVGICNNCYYRLSLAYHFKQQCESSDMRLRQYLGIRFFDSKRDAQTNTDAIISKSLKDDDDCEELNVDKLKPKRRSRYKRKTELKKRGPKPTVKVPHTCFNCNKNFRCLAQLQMHLRTHTGDKPYHCDYCPRRFSQKHNLIIHVRTHVSKNLINLYYKQNNYLPNTFLIYRQVKSPSNAKFAVNNFQHMEILSHIKKSIQECESIVVLYAQKLL